VANVVVEASWSPLLRQFEKEEIAANAMFEYCRLFFFNFVYQLFSEPGDLGDPASDDAFWRQVGLLFFHNINF